MSRLGLGTSQTLNSGIGYGKRKSPTHISWTTDADKYDNRHNYSYIVTPRINQTLDARQESNTWN